MANKARNKKDKFITRIDSKNTHGWNVRIKKGCKTHSKLFSDGRYNGKRKAKEAATEYRDELHIELFNEEVSERSVRRTSVLNTTGHIGVSVFYRERNGKIYKYYVSTWCPTKGYQKRKEFSVNEFGDKEAMNFATRHRKEQEKIILK